jgi:hypothetical protein
VIKTLGNLYSLGYLSPESVFVKLFKCLFQIHQEVGLLGVFTTGKSRFPCVLITVESFWTPGDVLLNFRSIQKFIIGYSNYLGTSDLCLKKLPYTRDSNRLPGVFITEESITNTNNSTIIPNNQNRIWTCQEKLFEEKTGDKKILDTVPFKEVSHKSREGSKVASVESSSFKDLSARSFYVFNHAPSFNLQKYIQRHIKGKNLCFFPQI